MDYRKLKWLTPGLQVKRWFLLLGVGLMLLAWGAYTTGTQQSSNPMPVMLIFIAIGIIYYAWFRWSKTLLSLSSIPDQELGLVELLDQKRRGAIGPKIITLGGGTGLSSILRGLKQYTGNLTAIVTVSDDGGSSGRLSKEYGLLPPGDIRNCLTALAADETLMQSLFQYRFEGSEDVGGHAFGNLFLAALTDIAGDFEEAVRLTSQTLAIRGQVIPVTNQPVTLEAQYKDGSKALGESSIPDPTKEIAQVTLIPKDCTPPQEVLTAIQEAELIVLGPGSLYTSIIPNLLVPQVAQALAQAKAPIVYICNIMTQPGETNHMTAYDHVAVIQQHLLGRKVDYVLANNLMPEGSVQQRYKEQGARPIVLDEERFREQGIVLIQDDLLETSSVLRHNPELVAQHLLNILEQYWSRG